ncbi:MAG: PAS domain S-box protein [Candidatus Heimdallarchaeota archaeon]
MVKPSTLRILMVDDDEVMLSIAQRFLLQEEPTFNITTAISSAEALQTLAKAHFDIIVSDYLMPDMDGLELLQALRDGDNPIPFIMFTGQGREEVAMQALNLGADYYLMKGVEPESMYGELTHVIRTVAEHRATKEALQASEERFRTLFSKANDAIFVIRLEGDGPLGHFIEVNDIACERYGYSREELLTMGPQQLNAPEKYEEHLQTDLPKTIRQDQPLTLQTVHVNKAGTRMPVEINSHMITLGDEYVRLAIVRDISGRTRADQALRESEAKFRAIFHHADDDIFVMELLDDGTVGRRLEVNDAVCKRYGYSREELLAMIPADLRPPDELDRLRQMGLPEIIRKGDPAIYDTIHVTKDGRQIPVEVNARTVTLGERQVRVAIARDRSGHKQAEKELKHQRDQLYFQAQLLESVRESVIATDLEGNVIYWSKGAENLYGHRADEVIGKSITFIVQPAEEAEEEERMRQVREYGFWKGQYIQQRKDGSSFWADTVISLVKDFDDKPIGLVGIDRDISESKQGEKVLYVAHRLLETANRHSEMKPLLSDFVAEIRDYVGCAAVGIRLIDESGNIPYEGYEGFSQSFYNSESPLSIWSDQCMCINVIKGGIDTSLPYVTNFGSFFMNGTTRFLAGVSEEEKGKTRNVCNAVGYESVALIPIRFREQILGLIHIADYRENMVPLDTVETLERAALQLATAIQRVLAEETLRAKVHELSEFAHTMGHDLKTPLFTIQSFADLLKKEFKHKDVEQISQTAKRAQALLRRSVELADAGQILEKSDEVDLNELVRTVSKEIIPPDIALEVAKLPVVRCDRLKAGQIFQNLFENAVIHGQPRRIEVRRQDGEDATHIMICNDGTQIPPENRLKIFDHRFTTAKNLHSGLGLSITEKLIRAHGWQISLGDTLDTSFIIQIPREP